MGGNLHHRRILPRICLWRIDLRRRGNAACCVFNGSCSCPNCARGCHCVCDPRSMESLCYRTSLSWSGNLWGGIYRIGQPNYPDPVSKSANDQIDWPGRPNCCNLSNRPLLSFRDHSKFRPQPIGNSAGDLCWRFVRDWEHRANVDLAKHVAVGPVRAGRSQHEVGVPDHRQVALWDIY